MFIATDVFYIHVARSLSVDSLLVSASDMRTHCFVYDLVELEDV